MNQRGFATLEVILMVMVIGILASIAVPRFNNVTTAANTAKIQSDLATIDTALAIYYMEQGSYPTQVSQLSDHIRDVANLKPPKGQAYINGDPLDISGDYGIQAASGKNEARAILTVGGKARTAGDFSTQKKN